jgi:hypothetical protein
MVKVLGQDVILDLGPVLDDDLPQLVRSCRCFKTYRVRILT